ncbi:DUF4407 domain-containing protein [Bacteroides zoogleoformans]|nr:DUF4407 domain-containing protein [Bacteroides zoogleoformans]
MNTQIKKTNESEELIKWGGWLNEFLWICSGANRTVLRQCPTDYAKYAGIGGTILFTALMATLSGGYALYFIFHSVEKAILFGIFWGMLIFNLDRFIVNTMYSDGKVTISWREFYSGLPRIIIAIFLGIVISTPLEMKIFEDRINSQLVKDNIERTNASMAEIDKGNELLIKRRDLLEQQKAEILGRLAKANEELIKEVEGAEGRIPGQGPIYKEKVRNKEAIEKELSMWESSYQNELDNIRKQIEVNRTKGNEDISKGNDENGFCVRYEAFSNVKNENSDLKIVSIIVMLLFIIIETAPTFFKMMIASGPYDDYLRAEMYHAKIMSDKRVSDINDEINTEVQISTQRNKERLEAEVLANRELMTRIAKSQAELLQTAIDKWREEELLKIKENPSRYIKTNTVKT